ncbi:ATG8 [Symbiodinium pilosum]|uniref:Autophagy-related protein n=1 Tax=Symbiodinium pilosum TaxID=2952 RepID=A0A812X3N0_SYMPI|nr:ATG8 [Symbiodinium pilosum]
MAPKSSRKGKGMQKLPFNDDAIQKHLEVKSQSQEDVAEAESEMDRPTSECEDQDIPEGFSSTEALHEEIRGNAPASGDLGRRIQGAAATIGGATGMLLGGPVSGALLGAAALYASTREDMSGSVARKAGSLYLKVADRACDEGVRVMDRGVEKAGAALDRGCRRLSQSSSVPAPIRAGLQQLSGDKREGPSVAPDEARKILEKHPDRIPIICERSAFSTLPQISKSKFAVPGGMRAGEFKYLVQKEIKRAVPEEVAGPQPEQTIYIFINGATPRCSTSMAELYEQHRREDGFLCVKYCAEQTLGLT